MHALDIAEDESLRVDLTESEMSHDVQPDEEEPKQEVVGGKRLADHPSVELEEAVEEGPRPPKVPKLQARKAVPPTLDDIERVAKETNQTWKEKLSHEIDSMNQDGNQDRIEFLEKELDKQM